MVNKTLTSAKAAQKDEFYTLYNDIQNEILSYLDYNPKLFKDKVVLLPCDDPEWSNFTKFFAQNFERFGLKKLISTGYAIESKKTKYGLQPDLFISNISNSKLTKGKIFTLTNDITGDGKIDIEDLQWDYLKGDGDFLSEEVSLLCDQADIIITNPPFSKFIEFSQWLRNKKKDFIIVSNINALTYREIFPLIIKNKIWLGNGFKNGASFSIPEQLKKEFENLSQYDPETGLVKFGNICWLTNLEHGRRHMPLPLMTMKENLRFNTAIKNNKSSYKKYENYDAIEVPRVNAIPSDYKEMMGVPVSFLEKHCPEQFDILGMCENLDLYRLKTKIYTREECQKAYYKRNAKKGTYDLNACPVLIENGIPRVTYDRIIIRHKK